MNGLAQRLGMFGANCLTHHTAPILFIRVEHFRSQPVAPSLARAQVIVNSHSLRVSIAHKEEHLLPSIGADQRVITGIESHMFSAERSVAGTARSLST